jgi:hypothetical protein
MSMEQDGAMRRLDERWAELAAMRLPPPLPCDGEAQDLRGDIIGYDSHVAGVVARVRGGHPVEGRWFAPRPELAARAEALATRLPAAVAYPRYVALLEEVLRLAHEVVAARGHSEPQPPDEAAAGYGGECPAAADPERRTGGRGAGTA